MALFRIGWLALIASFVLAVRAAAGDWPAWRFDSQRSASSPHALTSNLKPHWTLVLPPLTPAWPDQPMMPFDAAYEPIVVGQRMYVGSSRTDSISAYDTRTGQLVWRFLADGPVRFAPVVHAGKLYFTSDDGHLYCVEAATGAMKWKFRGGPTDRRILGNERLVSTWPARGAPVVADGIVYFAASIWPFMGTFIHALEADTGKVVWTNDGDGSLYIKQPHSADAFAGVAPQGPLAISGDILLIPGGRSVPAAYDRKTGKLRHFLLNDNSKKGGGHTVAVAKDIFVNGPGVFDTSTGRFLAEGSSLAVADGDVLYLHQSNEVRALDLKTAGVRPTITKPQRWKIDTLGAVPFKGATALIRAGDKLFVGRKNEVAALALPLPLEGAKLVEPIWRAAIEGVPASLVAADDRLFVSTREGRVYCFGGGDFDGAPPVPARDGPVEPSVLDAGRILLATAVTEGYAVVWTADIGLLKYLATHSKLHIIAIDPNADRVRQARESLIAADLYGERVAVHVGEIGSFSLPLYMASLMLVPNGPANLERAYAAVRPYGGVIYVAHGPESASTVASTAKRLPKAVLKKAPGGSLIIREGALPGSGDWTHEHADAANTRVSTDSVVKAPLGVLWFGGPSHEGILPRHGHGPQPQVVGGRVIIEGMDILRATDAYTGRLLWEAKLPGIGTFYNNLAHQPGANARGTNYISLPDAIYVAYQSSCIVLDPASGRRTAEFSLPAADGVGPRWGSLNVVNDYLIAIAEPIVSYQLEKEKKSPGRPFKLADESYAAGRLLAVLDRHTGKFLWATEARQGFRNNTVCAGGGKVFAIDRVSGVKDAKADGTRILPSRVVAYDLATGRELWHDDTDTFGTWLSYSEKFDILIEAGRVARDTLNDEPKGMRAYRGKDGAELWYDKGLVGPAMLHGDTILCGQGACELKTGKPRLRRDPISGAMEPWVWARTYGCNTPAASEHLLTFRSGAAGYFDLCHDGGTGNFGGFRSGCTNNLIVANGLLVAPDYTRTCTCSYQNQCSVALVPMAEAEEWTFHGKGGTRKSVQRVGINFGAPGDHMADDGTLWIEYPTVGGASPVVPVTVAGRALEYFRRHQTAITGTLPWVGASGVEGVESVAIGLQPAGSAERSFTVRLYFTEPLDLDVGRRTFDVHLQGRKVLDDLDVVKAAGRPRKTMVREFTGVRVADELRLSFHANTKRRAVLSGIEIVAE